MSFSETWACTRKEYLSTIRYPGWWMRFSVTPMLNMMKMLLVGVCVGQIGLSGTVTTPSGAYSFVGFLAVGLVLSGWAESMIWGPGWALYYEQKAGTLQALLVAPSDGLSMILGKALYDCIENIGSGILLLGAVRLIFGIQLTVNIVQLILALATTGLALYGFSLVFASLVVNSRDANSTSGIISMFLFVFSGSVYPITALPKWLRWATWISPLTWGIDACRRSLLLGQNWLASGSGWALVGYAVLLPVLGIWLYRKCIRRARLTGTLGLF